MWNKKTIKRLQMRPLLWVIGGYLLFLILFLGILPKDNPITQWLYGEAVPIEESGVYTVEAELLSIEPKVYGRKAILRIRSGMLRGVRIEGTWPENREELPGAYLCATVTLQSPSHASNPGEFDTWTYDRIRRVDYIFSDLSEVALLRDGRGLKAWLYTLRQRLSQQLDRLLPDTESSMLQAMLLGCNGSLDPTIKELFQRVGIAHIFAISGLHILLLYQWIQKGLRKLLGFRGGTGTGLVLLWLYVLMTGGAVSTLRAALMLSIREIGALWYREEDPVMTIAVTAFILLLYQPLYLLDAGFQLSFGALLSLQIVAPLFQHCFALPKYLRRWIGPSLAVSVGTGPITLWHFFQLCPYGVVLNWLVVPMMNGVLLLSMAACGLGLLSEGLARLCIGPVYYCLQLYQWMGEKVASWPGSLWILGRPSWIQILSFYGLLGLFALGVRYPKETRQGFLRKGGAVLLCLFCFGLRRIGKEQVTFLNVGQGDCAVIEWEGRTYLVDAGPKYESVIRPYLLYTGTTEVDGLFLSHFDEDHTAGAAKLLVDGDIRVRTLYLPAVNSEKDAEWAPLLQNYQEQGGTVMRWSAGMQMQVGEARFFCLSPNSQTDYASENDASMVLFWSVPGLRILFTGDISMMAEKTLQEASLAADVLKVAHHGSRTSTGEVFLAAVSPQLAVISAQKSVYGHPHPETTERLLAGQIEYRITEQTGAITVYRSRSKTLAWATYGGT